MYVVSDDTDLVRRGPRSIVMPSYYGSVFDRNAPQQPGHRNAHHKNVILFEPNGHVVMSTEEGRRGRSDPEGAVSVRCFSKDPPASRSQVQDDHRRGRIKDGFKYSPAAGRSPDFGREDFDGYRRDGSTRDGFKYTPQSPASEREDEYRRDPPSIGFKCAPGGSEYSPVSRSPSLGEVFDGNGRDGPVMGFKSAPTALSPSAARVALDDYFNDGPVDAFDFAQPPLSPGSRDEVLEDYDRVSPGHGFKYSPTVQSPVSRRKALDDHFRYGSMDGFKYSPLESPASERGDEYRRDPPIIGFKCAPNGRSPDLGRDGYPRDSPVSGFDHSPSIVSPSMAGEALDRYCKDGPAVGFNYGVAPYHVHHRRRHESSKERHGGKRRHGRKRRAGMRPRHNGTRHGGMRHHVQAPSDYRRIQDSPFDGT